MIILETQEQKEVLTMLLKTATVQGVENAKKLIMLYEALLNAKLESVAKDLK